jgi:hypothetical protein
MANTTRIPADFHETLNPTNCKKYGDGLGIDDLRLLVAVPLRKYDDGCCVQPAEGFFKHARNSC